jgi:hypothetical protein
MFIIGSGGLTARHKKGCENSRADREVHGFVRQSHRQQLRRHPRAECTHDTGGIGGERDCVSQRHKPQGAPPAPAPVFAGGCHQHGIQQGEKIKSAAGFDHPDFPLRMKQHIPAFRFFDRTSQENRSENCRGPAKGLQPKKGKNFRDSEAPSEDGQPGHLRPGPEETEHFVHDATLGAVFENLMKLM